MNVESLLMSIAGGLGLVTFAGFIYEWLCRFSERTANDVPPFLQRIDLEEVAGIFHPATETRLRESLSPKEFRKLQWKRFHLALHYCSNLSVNARVLQGWVRHDRKEVWDMLGDEMKETLHGLREACLQCRMASLVIRMRLHWWLIRMALFPFAGPPSFKSLLGSGSSDLISFYKTILQHAEEYSQAYGEEYHQRLMQAL
ncbi:MAG: hypothetical protein LAP21_03805 [Acidobacteriia bacterium]|nr:hypothetical protein [Terriglobia bacterium]